MFPSILLENVGSAVSLTFLFLMFVYVLWVKTRTLRRRSRRERRLQSLKDLDRKIIQSLLNKSSKSTAGTSITLFLFEARWRNGELREFCYGTTSQLLNLVNLFLVTGLNGTISIRSLPEHLPNITSSSDFSEQWPRESYSSWGMITRM